MHTNCRRLMFRPLAILVAAGLVVSGVAVSPDAARSAVIGLTDCRFSKAQVFDVQWNISGGMLNVSGMTRPYASFEPRTGQLREDELDATDTFAFYTHGPQGSESVGFRQFNAVGDLIRTLHQSGTFRATGPDFIFYNGNNSWGTLISSGEGFQYGDSAALAVTAENVSIADALTYSSCAAVPLIAGQTRAQLPSSEPVSMVTPPPAVSCDGATLRAGATLVCNVTGAPADFDFLWRVAVNSTIVEGVLTTGPDGTGTMTIPLPADVAGKTLTVELVDWTGPMVIGVVSEASTAAGAAGGPVPSGVPAGTGGFAGVVGIAELVDALAIAVALALGLMLAARGRSRQVHRS